MGWGVGRAASVAGACLHVREAGEGGTPVLLLHDALDTAEAWAGVAPALAQRHRVLAPDLRGHGASERFDGEANPWTHLSTRAVAADAAALIRSELGDGPVHVVGAGLLGGGAAQVLATEDPDLLRSLTLIASPVNPGEAARGRFRRQACSPPSPEEARTLERLHGADYGLELRQRAVTYLASLPEEDLPRELLVTFKKPVLVIEPALDPLYSPVSTMFVRAWLNHAEHERPEAFNARPYATPEGAAWLAARLGAFLRG